MIAILATLFGCGPLPQEKIPVLNRDLAWDLTVKAAKMVPRHSGTPGAEQQAEFIAATAGQFGAEVKVDKFTRTTPFGNILFRNVIATLPGKSSDFLIIGCHYDAKKLSGTEDFQAANDGASGVALLLAMIKAVHNSPDKPPYSLRFVFFDGEECCYGYNDHDGLFGSRHYSEALQKNGELKRCRAMFLADMIGDKDLLVRLPADTPGELSELCFKSAEAVGKKPYFDFYHEGMIDDHTPFRDKGVPAVNLIDFSYGPDNSYWHTPEDKIENISADSIKTVGDVLLTMIYRIN